MNRHLLLSLPLCVLASHVSAQTVLSANDEASLRTAINTANGSGDFVINLAAGTIAITGATLENGNAQGDFDITKSSGSLVLNGTGAGTIIDGGGNDRLFHINTPASVTVTFQNMRMQNGRASDNGTSQAQEGRGGAIYIQTQTPVTLDNVTLANNQARAIDGVTGAGGGGFGSSGKASFGGAIYCGGGTLTITQCTLSQNTSRGGDGGDGIVGSNIQGTSICTGGNGGGGGSGGTGFGGAIYLATGTLNITASTLNANTARGGDGGNGAKGGNGSASGVSFSVGIGGRGGGGGFGNQGTGGALYVVNGTVILENSTLSGNTATAGTGGDGADGGDGMCIGASTSKQTVGGGGGNGGNTGATRGGAVFIANGTVNGRNSTVAFNTAVVGVGGSGGPVGAGTAFPYSSIAPGMPGIAQPAQGGGLLRVAGTLTITSSIVADNSATGSGAGGQDVHGAATANNSLIESPAGASITGAANVFADPQLAALANNGGATQTHALSATSPAVDTGSNTLALTTDQRGSGFARQFGSGPDIGSFERQSAGAPPPPAISSPVAPLTLNANNLNIQGTAPPNTLVRIYTDINNDGLINGSDAIVASQQLTGGLTVFSISTPLQQNFTNNFLVTQSAGVESAPTDVPSLTEDSQAPNPPTVFNPAGAINVAGPTFDISGSSEADSLVQIFSDINNNGVIDAGDVVVGSQQLTGGGISFVITVPINTSTTNDFLATSTDSALNESTPTDVATITEVTVTQAPAPTVTTPAANLLVNAPDFVITGTAQAGLLVRVYSDANDNGTIDGADAVVGSQQLTTGQTGYAITVTLAQNAPNYFLVTAEGVYFTESAPTDVPTITDDAGFTSNPPSNSGGGGGGCSSEGTRGLWFLLTCVLAFAIGTSRRLFGRSA